MPHRILLALLLVLFASALSADEFDALRLRWRDFLTGGTNLDTGEPAVANALDSLAAAAQSYWDRLEKSSSRSFLWSDLPATDTQSAQITTSYDRLKKMALAYVTKGSRLEAGTNFLADIILALDWMWAKRYNASKSEYGNWWDWEIGAPLHLNDITSVLFDKLSSAQIKNYMDAVNHFTPSPTKTGANRVWQATVVGVRGAIVKDSSKLALARDGLSKVFTYATSGDGFYTDGSFIQHDIFPYNGGYGNSLLANIVPLMLLLNGSAWQVTDPNGQNVFRWIHLSFEPLAYKGAMMDMVRGREISRSASSDHAVGAMVISSVIRAAQLASSGEATRLRSLAKSWILSDTYREYLRNAPVPLIPEALQLLNDTNLAAQAELAGHFTFARMDRAVHRRPDFAFGISMSSKRIGNYEVINAENLRGWYTADGMTYLYNGDLGQFSDGFWPTVNAYRLPGTTVDTMSRSPGSGSSYKSSYSWVGGTSVGEWGSSGMQLDAYNSKLIAKKSWFMFDDEIVALGAGITCGDNRVIETIVENRRLNPAGDNPLTLNGNLQPVSLGLSSNFTNVVWAHLKGNAPDSDIGYYFPGIANVKQLREARTGSWYDINNKSGDPTLLTRNYLTLWLDHGAKPSAASYSYILLPNKSPDEVRTYALHPDVIILENSANAQAVSETRLGVKAVNFWNDSTYTVSGITVTKKSSVMIRQSADELEVAVSDPTQAASSLTVQVDTPAAATNGVDAGITVQALTPKLKLSVNVKNAAGKTLRARFRLSSTQAESNAAPIAAAQASPALAPSFLGEEGPLPGLAGDGSDTLRPNLSCALRGGNILLLSWPDDWPGWRLQALTNPASEAWFDIPGGDHSPVALPIMRSESCVFFRLKAP